MTRPPKSPKRVYVDAPLDSGQINLDQERAHYLGRVLRCREGDEVIVFNARGSERLARIEALRRDRATVALGSASEPIPEPQRHLFLLQALVKSDAMDSIVQKATELGAHTILATTTKFSVVRLANDRKPNRLAHWRRIAISACEQSGRHRPPDIEVCDSLTDAVSSLPDDCARVALSPGADVPLAAAAAAAEKVCLAIGPEGGFSDDETRWLKSSNFSLASLGPRILRADTAAIAALANFSY